jgi:hypothetical protein
MPTCPLCHANLPPNQSCQDIFDQCLALEFEHPSAFGAVHHLTVLCYYLQHNLYSPQGWLEGRRLLERFVQEGASPDEVRKQAGPRLQSGKRSWRVTGGEKEPGGEDLPDEKLPGVESLSWSRTIASLRLDDPQIYCAGVRLWAESVLLDSQAFTAG